MTAKNAPVNLHSILYLIIYKISCGFISSIEFESIRNACSLSDFKLQIFTTRLIKNFPVAKPHNILSEYDDNDDIVTLDGSPARSRFACGSAHFGISSASASAIAVAGAARGLRGGCVGAARGLRGGCAGAAMWVKAVWFVGAGRTAP